MSGALLLDERIIAITPSLVRALDGKATDAIVLQQIHWWLQHATNEHDGHVWVYNTYDEWADLTGLSADQVRRAISRLEDAGLVISAQPGGRDRTRWYRIDYGHSTLTPSGEIARSHSAKSPDDSIGTEKSRERKTVENRESTTEIVDALAEHVEQVKGRRPRTSPDSAWRTAAIDLLSIEKAPLDEILEVIAWLAGSDFWRAKVTNVRTLYRNYTQLVAQMRDDDRQRVDRPGRFVG